MQTSNLSRVTSQSHPGHGAVGLHVPHPDGLVVRARHDAVRVELDAADATSVTLKGPDLALATQPTASQLVPLLEDILPLDLASLGADVTIDLSLALIRRQGPRALE